MKYSLSALALVLLTSCGSNPFGAKSNDSALYSPPCVTLTKGIEYQFDEGKMTGNGEKFVSQFYYQRALVTGE
jgi:hypothetical protein